MEFIKYTPTWVFVLFVFLVIIGVKALRSQTISFRRLLILPTVFAIWNFSWLLRHPEEKYSFFALWLIGIVIGAIIGWQSVRVWKIKANHRTRTITLPGSAFTLIFILIVFCVRYYFAYKEAVTPNISLAFLEINAGVSGVFTGVFVGRSLELYRKYTRARG